MTIEAVIDLARPETPAIDPALPDPKGPLIHSIEDVDDKELQEAKAAAEAEEAAGKGEPGTEPSNTGKEPSAQQEQKQPAAADVPMIPKPRLDEALGKLDKAQQDVAYWRGVADARGTQPFDTVAAPGTGPAPAETPEQKLAAIHDQIEALAKKFDDGEISMVDYKKQERALDDQRQTLREEVLLAKVKPADAPKASGDELYLETLTRQLETQHPWVQVFDKVGKEHEWAFLEATARQNLAARGIALNGTPAAKLELRSEIARLCDGYGPSLVGERAKEQGLTLPGQQPSKPQDPAAKPGLSPAATARQTKLDVAANAPLDLKNLTGATGEVPGQVSESQLEAMSDEEIGALPDATRKRLLGIT